MKMRPRSAGDWVALVLRIFLGSFYVIAGAVKISDPGQFAQAIANYRLLPHETLNSVAIILPWIEIVAGLFLIFGIWFLASAWLINAMTTMFIVAIAAAVARGLSIECGCFGTVGGRSTGIVSIIQDLILLTIGIWLVWRPEKKWAPTVTETDSAPSPARS
jgi:uncharacterized membrane protein YphA (DoxX/SURF4 family)